MRGERVEANMMASCIQVIDVRDKGRTTGLRGFTQALCAWMLVFVGLPFNLSDYPTQPLNEWVTTVMPMI